MSTSPPQDQITLLLFRVDALERTVAGFNQQMSAYVRERENDLKLKILQDTASHIGDEVGGVKNEVRIVRDEVSLLKDDIQKRDAALRTEMQNRDIAQQKNQSQLFFKILVGVLSTISLTVTGVLVGYITHFFK
ncbi:MAG TPA: hypothetical protein VKR06_46185 [Ktedonosporobacter sp.]|nr:hypothetical protein [Ktedonosporobacter sp.]